MIPWAIVAIIAINAAVLCIEHCPGLPNQSWIGAYGLVPQRVMHWQSLGGDVRDPRRYLPIVTAMFLHDGWIHLATNMMYLWVFGRALEGRLGRAGIIATYAISGIAASLGQLIAHPLSSSAMVGASGAIAGLLGAYLVSFPSATITLAFPFFLVPWILPVRAVWFLLGWFALQVGKGSIDLVSHVINPQIAWWAHTSGFVAGLAAALSAGAWKDRAVAAGHQRHWANK